VLDACWSAFLVNEIARNMGQFVLARGYHEQFAGCQKISASVLCVTDER